MKTKKIKLTASWGICQPREPPTLKLLYTDLSINGVSLLLLTKEPGVLAGIVAPGNR